MPCYVLQAVFHSHTRPIRTSGGQLTLLRSRTQNLVQTSTPATETKRLPSEPTKPREQPTHLDLNDDPDVAVPTRLHHTAVFDLKVVAHDDILQMGRSLHDQPVVTIRATSNSSHRRTQGIFYVLQSTFSTRNPALLRQPNHAGGPSAQYRPSCLAEEHSHILVLHGTIQSRHRQSLQAQPTRGTSAAETTVANKLVLAIPDNESGLQWFYEPHSDSSHSTQLSSKRGLTVEWTSTDTTPTNGSQPELPQSRHDRKDQQLERRRPR